MGSDRPDGASIAVGIFFGLVGVLIGPFVGACIAELTVAGRFRDAGMAGIGATAGLAIGVAAKMALAFVMLGIFAVMRMA